MLRAAARPALVAMVVAVSAMATQARAQEVTRREIARSAVAGTDKEMVLVEVTIPPGATSPRHTHPGEEAFYVVQGSTIEYPDKPATARDAGSGGITAREVPHAGYKNVGATTLKQISVYVVDKGKPLSSPAK